MAYVCLAKLGMTDSEYQACLRCLLEKPEIDVNLADNTGHNPLLYAIYNSDTTALSMLMEYKNQRGLDCNKRGTGHYTPLTLAVAFNRVNHIKLLLRDRSVDPNLCYSNPPYGGHPLHFTVSGEYLEQPDGRVYGISELIIMRDLVECGAAIESYVHNAAYSVLLKGCGLVDNKLNDRTPLQLALANCPVLESNLGYERILALLACGAAVTHEDIYAFIPRYILTKSGIVLIDFWSDCCNAAVKGTVLESTFKDLPELLNEQDKILHMTPLMWAAARGNLLLAQQLVKLGADVTIQDRFGYTALHFAALNGHPDLVKFILSIAPDLRIVRNNNGRTPLDIVIRAKKSDATLDALELPGDKK